MKRVIGILLGLCLLAGGAAPGAPGAPVAKKAQTKTEYMAILVGGQKLGYVENVRRADGDTVTTSQRMVLTIRRMGMALKLEQSESTVESAGGEPLSFVSTQNFGMTAQTTAGAIKDHKVKVTVTSGQQVRESEIAWPEGALLSEGLRLLSISKGFKEGTRYTAKAFMPSMLNSADANMVIGAKKQVDLLGRVVELTEARSVLSGPTGQIESVGYLDADGDALKTVTPMLGMQMEMVACTKEFATMPGESVDLFSKVFVACPSPLGNLGAAASVTYRIEPTNPSAGASAKLDFLESPSQKVTRDGNSIVVTVRPVAGKGGALPYKGADPATVKALKATQYLQSDAEEVVALARKAVAGAKDAAGAARQIQDFVSKYVTRKDLSVGYASALEVAKSRQGDCSEHAVLAAAMCRAAGLPAQVVMGVVYVESMGGRRDVFGPHAWFRALIDGVWVDYDAAMGSYDAGHVALYAGDGDPSDFFGVVNTLGNFRIAEAERK
jgi:hypothetical protein